MGMAVEKISTWDMETKSRMARKERILLESDGLANLALFGLIPSKSLGEPGNERAWGSRHDYDQSLWCRSFIDLVAKWKTGVDKVWNLVFVGSCRPGICDRCE
jgi:hypothetical protein